MKKPLIIKQSEIEQRKQSAEKIEHAKRSKFVDMMLTLMQEFPDKAEQFVREGRHRREEMSLGA